ncbi:gamma carbonic anhydrase family protein [Brevibacillus sp. H7]|uniref:gamma carbonic anhydrase family protein n=1 Tax=Brevibacillus sp. H7 TaxID=3349138 RepID=UPI00381FA9EE
MLYPFQGRYPRVADTAFLAPGARIIGDVVIGEHASVWFNSVIRGDESLITLGAEVNVQDNCTLHSYEGFPLVLEDRASVGHNVILHGCTVLSGALIGMGSILLDGVEIGEEAFVAAHTFIPSGKVIPPRVMVMGSPGKIIRELTESDLEIVRMTTRVYRQRAEAYRQEYQSLP